MVRLGWRFVIALPLLALAALPRFAFASGGAYQVDTAEVSSPGNCKIESWASGADNRDNLFAISPSCTMYYLRPIEIGTQFSYGRADGEYGSAAAPKVKVNLIPGELGKFGLGFTVIPTIDMKSGQVGTVAFNLPATMRTSENTRFNVNVGYTRDRIAEKNFLTYGFGLDIRTPDNVWTLTAEAYGQLNSYEVGSGVQPRFQVGLRYRPIERFSVDVIYGRNITGENANWLTVATILRFPADK
jgi:hypothetical protein